jgi:hypothetical protein
MVSPGTGQEEGQGSIHGEELLPKAEAAAIEKTEPASSAAEATAVGWMVK